MKISEVMTTSPIACKADDTIRFVAKKMVMRRCGSIPVIDNDNKLIGIVTIRDTMMPLYPNFGEYVHDSVHGRDFEEMEENYKRVLCMKVKEVMTPDPLTVSKDDSILKAASYMGLRNLRRIPVTEDGKLIGMVSIGDIARGLYIHQGI
ncbi:MAG: inosine-5-monophosphate dehydrogenase [Zetaproteobacteria bacterium CG_4_9_14_3_um_filter_49_83]|nr:MAG: inosine-5-monophosphate dehydrogenase [Zetaproteobacteria bacterium CG1_02_49_23]PIQ33447.1 MAG: inosine-5-monophosphate dehydrogenase [Zetaproteobacteria bacterium CG17_big_fil_post_rev_8_21_14_2_50_50_13]PIV29116.1 MAG: inosine-5-monophosphate dehydrogenase [Zetaproteobacteria bacterium CG02_land_8_20_14_3_00_50_9]PIY55654.1 MAG: inosine-5-monophosphate dehydrogenase [Zetaproteobacteria bacterium CG_4_10_14_0_8_um_filter_49_80]PJA36004.1 MAG: inosine-5-monophosphate dehydrogenase [Zet